MTERQDIMPDREDQPARGFGLSTATSVVLASMVGVGILTTSGYIIKDTGSHALMLALWLAGGLLALCGALSVAELAAAWPRAGGEYVFIREAYGRPWAFLYGWVSLLIGFSAPATIVAHAAARYLSDPWLPESGAARDVIVRALAALLLIVLTVVHLRGHRVSSRVQSFTTLLKIAVLLMLAFGGLLLGRGNLSHLEPDLPSVGLPWSVMGISLIYVMFSYSGWNAATYLAGEIRSPERLLPRALLMGCGAVVALYLLLNVMYVVALPAEVVVAMSYEEIEPIAALAAGRLFGPWIAVPFSLAIGVGLLASLSAFILTGPRVYQAMAMDGLFPSFAAKLDPVTNTPSNAILVQAACSLVLLFTGTFRNILTYTGVGLSLSSFFVVLALIVLRVRRPHQERPFRTPLYPLPPLLFLACGAWMIVFAFDAQPYWSSISIASILAGIPIYYFTTRRLRNRDEAD